MNAATRKRMPQWLQLVLALVAVVVLSAVVEVIISAMNSR